MITSKIKKILVCVLFCVTSEFANSVPFVFDGKDYDWNGENEDEMCCYTCVYIASKLFINFMDEYNLEEELYDEANRLICDGLEDGDIIEIPFSDEYIDLNQKLNLRAENFRKKKSEKKKREEEYF